VRKLTGVELENYLKIKRQIEEIWMEDAKLREELVIRA